MLIFEDKYTLIRIQQKQPSKIEIKPNEDIIFWTLEDEIQGFSINKKYLIIWTKYEVYHRIIDQNNNNF